MASGNQIEGGTATRPRRRFDGAGVCADPAVAAMALPVDVSVGHSQDCATLPIRRSARHDRVMMMSMMPMAESLPDVTHWLRSSGLEIVLLVLGAILLTRLATWLRA